jgi:hypothetical protein
VSDRDELLALRRMAELEAKASGTPQGLPRSLLDRAAGAATDTAASLITGAAAAPVAGLAGIAGAVLPGPEGQGADWVKKVQGALTATPQTPEGDAALNVVTKPMQWLESGADKAGAFVADQTKSPALGAAVNTALQMAPAIVSRLAGGKVRETVAGAYDEQAKVKSQNSVRDATLAEGRDVGYVVPPDTSMFRGIAGKAALRQEAIVRNQQVTNSLARKALGIPDEVPLSPGVLEQKRLQLSAPYKELSAIDPEAASVLQQIREIRSEANGWYKAFDRDPKPPYQKRAERLSSKADALEGYLDEIAVNAGKPDLVPAMKEARKNIARTYDVERALNKGDGNIDAHVLGNLYDNGKPLSGELATIGKFDQAFRRYTTEASRVEAPGGSALTPISAAGLGMGGHATGLGWFPAGIALAGGPARSLLLSGMYQSPRSYTPSLGLRSMSPFFDEASPLFLGAAQASK